MPRPSPNLNHLLAVAQRRRLEAPTGDSGVQWFVDLRFDELAWYRDRRRLRSFVDGIAAAAWFADFDVMGLEHRAGTSFELATARDAIASGHTGNAIFASGGPRGAVNVEQAESALSINVCDGRLELRLWLAGPAVRRHGRKTLDDVITWVLDGCALVPEALLAHALAFPRPTDGLPHPRSRPLRIAHRALDAVVDIVDRRAPAEGPPWGPDSLAIASAPVPPDAVRTEHGPFVVVQWIDDPSDPSAMAAACARHERWLSRVVPTRLAPGWNEAGDLASTHDPRRLVEADAEGGLPRARPRSAAVFADREAAVAAHHAAREAGFEAVLYRGTDGTLWDPFPPGVWSDGLAV